MDKNQGKNSLHIYFQIFFFFETRKYVIHISSVGSCTGLIPQFGPDLGLNRLQGKVSGPTGDRDRDLWIGIYESSTSKWITVNARNGTNTLN